MLPWLYDGFLHKSAVGLLRGFLVWFSIKPCELCQCVLCTLVQCLVNIVWEIEGNTDSVLFLHLCELESARFANTELGLIWWLDELPAMTRLPPAAPWRWWWWWWWCYNDLIKMKVIMMIKGSARVDQTSTCCSTDFGLISDHLLSHHAHET